jgi:hypothetical protein
MAPKLAVWQDNRLEAIPMTPVVCRTCGARVLARKSSWKQTSVQWNADATARCAERCRASRAGELAPYHGRTLFLGCSALTDSIVDAIVRGTLPLVDDARDNTDCAEDPPAR